MPVIQFEEEKEKIAKLHKRVFDLGGEIAASGIDKLVAHAPIRRPAIAPPPKPLPDVNDLRSKETPIATGGTLPAPSDFRLPFPTDVSKMLRQALARLAPRAGNRLLGGAGARAFSASVPRHAEVELTIGELRGVLGGVYGIEC